VPPFRSGYSKLIAFRASRSNTRFSVVAVCSRRAVITMPSRPLKAPVWSAEQIVVGPLRVAGLGFAGGVGVVGAYVGYQ